MKKDLSVSCKQVLDKQDTGDGRILIADDVLEAESWHQANSDKWEDAHIWLALMTTAAAKQRSLTNTLLSGGKSLHGKISEPIWWRESRNGSRSHSLADGGGKPKMKLQCKGTAGATKGVKIESCIQTDVCGIYLVVICHL